MSILLDEGESYGYAIIASVRELSNGVICWTDGMLYSVLHRLENQALISSTWRLPDEGRRRKYYRLTAEGHRALERERLQWLRVHSTLERAWAKHGV